MSDPDGYLARPDVETALVELVAQRLQLTEDGYADAELPSAADYLSTQGIDVPPGASPTLIRTLHESDVEPLAPMCNGERARPVNCRWIGKQFVCDWVCP